MTTDNKTLADVQPGGRVRLGDQAFAQGCDELRTRTYGEMAAYLEGVADGRRAPFSAQPSPGGQGDARAIIEEFVQCATLGRPHGKLIAQAKDYLAARQPVGAVPQGCDACHRTGIRQNDEGRNICCPDCDLGRACAGDTRQPVGEPVDDYDSAFQEPDHAPYLVDAAGYYALQSFLTVAEEFRRSAEPYIEAINEGGSAGDDEISEVFDSHLNHAKRAVSRSTMYAAAPAQAVDLGQFRDLAEFALRNAKLHNCWEKREALARELLALIDSQAVRS